MDAPTEMLEFPKLDRIQRRTNRRCADGAIAAELPVRLNRDYGLHRPLQAPAAHQAHSVARMHFTALRQSRLTQINFGGNPRPILLPDLNGVTLHAARNAASRVDRVASDHACPGGPDRRTTRQGLCASQLRALPRD